MPHTETPAEEPHDVLAAEAFGFPAADPDLHHHGPVVPPEDPTGIEEPHDVLAAEEYPMPASRPVGLPARMAGERPWALLVAAVFGFLLGVWALRRR